MKCKTDKPTDDKFLIIIIIPILLLGIYVVYYSVTRNVDPIAFGCIFLTYLMGIIAVCFLIDTIGKIKSAINKEIN